MASYILAPAAKEDLEAILRWSHEHFGEEARLRYEALLVRAILDIAEDANRAGSQQRPELADAARTYHIRNSRDRVEGVPHVKQPRHFLLYRLTTDGQIEVGRVLHDSMDLSRHLPDDYESAASDEV